MFAAAVLIVTIYIFSIEVPRFLFFGNGAPVNPKSIYILKLLLNHELEVIYQIYALQLPASLQAARSVNAATF